MQKDCSNVRRLSRNSARRGRLDRRPDPPLPPQRVPVVLPRPPALGGFVAIFFACTSNAAPAHAPFRDNASSSCSKYGLCAGGQGADVEVAFRDPWNMAGGHGVACFPRLYTGHIIRYWDVLAAMGWSVVHNSKLLGVRRTGLPVWSGRHPSRAALAMIDVRGLDHAVSCK